MTRYLLQSGGLKKQPKKAESYFSELFAGSANDLKLLWCFFASEPEEYESNFAHYIKTFTPFFPPAYTPNHKLANQKTFEEDLSWCDVVYLHGGNFDLIKNCLKDFDLTEIFKSKTVGLNSASGMVLSEYSWSCDTQTIEDGFGILPVKFIPHFEAALVPNGSSLSLIDWQQAKHELTKHGDQSLPLVALTEGDYIVLEVWVTSNLLFQ